MIERFERIGLGLPDEKRKKVNELYKEIIALNAEFQKNINADNRFILVKDDELPGMQKDFTNAPT